MVLTRETELLRHDAASKGRLLSPGEREHLLRPYLPPGPGEVVSRKKISQPLQDFLQNQLHLVVFTLIHLLFSVYVKLRKIHHSIVDKMFAVLYYHHRAPELIKQDVKSLSRLPKHLSVILELKQDEKGTAGLEALMNDVAEISAWCSCVGIPMLSIYEKTGVLKNYIPSTHRTVVKKMYSYFGRQTPSIQMRAPHLPPFADSEIGPDDMSSSKDSNQLSILLLSSEDGRSTLVDLTKTLAEMSQCKKLLPDDVTQELVDAEITESVMAEPELLVLFGPSVELQGYPPWQARLTEIFHVEGNVGVGYQVFLRALHRFANAQMKFGR